jgi:hypothetical protein
LVDVEACQDSNRKAFFEWLEIKKCDQAEVCRMIMECYTPFRGRSLDQSVQDLLYLFQTPRSVYNKSLDQFQLVRASPFSNFASCKRLYIEEPDTTSIITKYKGNVASNMPLPNQRYLEEIRRLGKESEFVIWACSHLKISTQPRLVGEHSLTQEFYFLAANGTKDLLLLLRDHWDRYSRELNRPTRLKIALSGLKVICKDGISQRLDQTARPLSRMISRGPHVPFADIPDPDDSRWHNFSIFGFLVGDSSEFYLRELKAFAALPVTGSTSKIVVQSVYRRLEREIFKERDNITSTR